MSHDPHQTDLDKSRYFAWLASLTPTEREAIDTQADRLTQPLYAAFKDVMRARPDLPEGIWVHMASRLFLVLEYQMNTSTAAQPTEEPTA